VAGRAPRQQGEKHRFGSPLAVRQDNAIADATPK